MKDEQMLRYAVENGIIDIDTLQMKVEMNERKKYLEMHNHSIWEGKNGYYYTKIDEEDRKKLVKRKTKEALETAVVNHYKSKVKEPTVEAVFQQWIEKKLEYKEIQNQTAERYIIDFNRFFEPCGFSKRKIKFIKEIDLENFVKTSIAENQLTSKAYGNMRTLIYGIFKYAKKCGFTDISITSFFGDLDISRKAFTKNRKSDEQYVFTEEEMRNLTNDLWENPTIGNLGVLFAAYTGMRVGEIVALKWEDIRDNYIYVHRNQIRYRNENGDYVYEIRDTPKTEAGIRKVIMVESLSPVIRKLRAMNPFTEYVFQRGEKPITKYVIQMSLYRACERIGITRRPMHSLRKTYATRLINSHIDDAIIINQMGHTDIKTTRNYYYFNDKPMDSIRDKIGTAINY